MVVIDAKSMRLSSIFRMWNNLSRHDCGGVMLWISVSKATTPTLVYRTVFRELFAIVHASYLLYELSTL